MGRYAMSYIYETAAFPQAVGITPSKLGYISAYTQVDGADADVGENSLRVKVQGTYLVFADVAVTVDSADNFYISIYKNGVFTGFRNGNYVSTAGLGHIAVHGVLELNVDDVVTLYINSGSDASYEVTVGASQFSLVGI